jgi:hypothetical protein
MQETYLKEIAMQLGKIADLMENAERRAVNESKARIKKLREESKK